MAQSFTTDVIQWQGVDSYPVLGSENLVESGRIAEFTVDLKCLDGITSSERSVANNIKEFRVEDRTYYGYRLSVVCNDTNFNHRIGFSGPNAEWVYADNAVGPTTIGDGIVIDYDWDNHTNNVNIDNFNNCHIEIAHSIIKEQIIEEANNIEQLVEEKVIDCKLVSNQPTELIRSCFENIEYLNVSDEKYYGYRISVIYNDNSIHHRIGLRSPDNTQWIYIDNAIGYTKITDGITIKYNWDNHQSNYVIADYSSAGIELSKSDVSRKIFDTAENLINTTSVIKEQVNEKVIDCKLLDGVTDDIAKCFDNIEYLNVSDEKYYGYRISVIYNDNTFHNRIGFRSPDDSDWIYVDNAVGYTTIEGITIKYNWSNHQSNYIVGNYASAGIELSESDVSRKVYDISESIFLPLKGKNVAVLGDSIMMLMRNNYTGSNIVTFKDTDDNIYQCSEVTTNSAGKAVLISDTSKEVQMINSNQTALNNQNWEALSNLLMVKSLVNLGVGGAKVREEHLITNCPTEEYGTPTVPFDLNGSCLPNEVRWLKSLTQNGIKPIPDCIIIWCGTNESVNNPVFDNYDTIMGLSWDNISAETAQGHSYRGTLYGGLRYSVEFLCREYPYATIILLSPIQSRCYSTQEYDTGNMQQIADAIKKMSDRYSCIFIDALRTCGIVDLFEKIRGDSSTTSRWLEDGLHPNAAGKTLMSNFLAKRVNDLYFSKT
jgi:hypothetical protein